MRTTRSPRSSSSRSPISYSSHNRSSSRQPARKKAATASSHPMKDESLEMLLLTAYDAHIVHKQSIKAEESVLEEDTQRENINNGEERGNSERALEGVREKHKDILEKLELNLESAREQSKGREEEPDHPERE